MVLGGTLRPLPSEPIAGRNPLLQGRESGIPGSGNCAIARAATPVAVPDSPPPPVHDDLGATADRGARRLSSSVLAPGLSIPPGPRRHPALPETRFTGAGCLLPNQSTQAPRSLPLALYFVLLRVSPPAGFDSPAGGGLQRAKLTWNEGCRCFIISPRAPPGEDYRP